MESEPLGLDRLSKYAHVYNRPKGATTGNGGYSASKIIFGMRVIQSQSLPIQQATFQRSNMAIPIVMQADKLRPPRYPSHHSFSALEP